MGYSGSIPPPDGVTPNLNHPFDALRTCCIVVQVLNIIVVTGFVALRVYAKSKVMGVAWGWDDCKSMPPICPVSPDTSNPILTSLKSAAMPLTYVYN